MLLLGLGAALLAAGACAQRPLTPLTQAAARNDVAALRHLLDDGLKADEGGDSWTALIWAARQIPDYDHRHPWRAAEIETKVNRAFTDGMRQPRAARRG